jgi:hypothetical protein
MAGMMNDIFECTIHKCGRQTHDLPTILLGRGGSPIPLQLNKPGQISRFKSYFDFMFGLNVSLYFGCF